jgi:ribosomal protein S1
VRLIAEGTEFDDGAAEQEGHIQLDFGPDTPFLYEDVRLTPATEQRVKGNVQKLVEFTAAVEKNSGVTGRVLWSESEENLAQKLIARLQRVQ